MGTYRVCGRGEVLGCGISVVGDITVALKLIRAGRYLVVLTGIGRGASQYGNLSKAAKYGVMEYGKLSRLLKKTGLQAHYLIKQRFSGVMGQEARRMASIAVTQAEHEVFTAAWRQEFPHGLTNYGALSRQQVLDAARRIYRNYPAILRALGL